MLCSPKRMQPLDSELSAHSGTPACPSLPNHLLGAGGTFSWEPWPSSLALPAGIVGGQKVKSWGPQDSEFPWRDTACAFGRSFPPLQVTLCSSLANTALLWLLVVRAV